MNERTIHDELRERFPQMRPINSPPSLGTLNGFGLKMSGKREFDRSTQTYIKTRCFAALFIPVLAISAYRVADAPEGGWYFLGKERLSGFAKLWNLVLVLACAGILYTGSTAAKRSSPEYAAKKQIEKAEDLAAKGDHLGAAKVYDAMLNEGAARADEAMDGLRESLDQALASQEKVPVLGALRLVSARGDANSLVPDLAARARTQASKFGSEDPAWAIDALDAAADHVPDDLVEAYDEDRLALLLKLTAASPGDAGYAVRLATVYERQGAYDKLAPLLEPHRDKLGDSEGARILGQTWAAQGNWEGAYPLLQTYLKDRLATYHRNERKLNNLAESIESEWIDYLDQGKAPQKFYTDYENSNDAGKQSLVTEFLNKKFDASRPYQVAVERLIRSSGVVSVAMDFGMVQLNRAQSIEDPAQRKKLLLDAEKTFVSLQSSVGESNSARINLAQVYFWLGKNREADTMFEQILSASSRSLEDLYLVASTKRDLGDSAGARKLLEEAYGKATEDAIRYQIAGLRANTATDTDDSIAWWAKSDQKSPNVQISLASSRGDLALEGGDEKKAIAHFEEALAGYAKLPEGVGTLNNTSLVHLRLAPLTGDLGHYTKATELLGKAAKMEPTDPILITNLSSLQLQDAVRKLFAAHLDINKFYREIGLRYLSALYKDEAGRQEIVGEFAGGDDFGQMLDNHKRASILAPKNKGNYEAVNALYQMLDEDKALVQLRDKILSADLEFSEELADLKESLSGKNDAETLKQIQPTRDRYAALLADPEIKTDAIGWSIIATSSALFELALPTYGGSADVAAAVALAKKAFERNPSSYTRGGLVLVHANAALAELSKTDRELARDWKAYRRTVSASSFIALLLERGGPLAEKIAANKHTQTMVGLMMETQRAFPKTPDLDLWACLKNFDPEGAKTLAAEIAADKTSPVEDEIDHLLSPLGAEEILYRYWRHRATGNHDEARKIYRDALNHAPILPPL